MSTVFRIETPEGHGICADATGICARYHKASDHRRGCGHHTCFGNQTQEAGFFVIVLGWKFGFASMKQALEWFPLEEGRKAMQDAGAVLREYKTPAVLESVDHDQVIFDPGASRLVATYDLATLKQQENV